MTTMTVETKRLPLREFSSSKINKLGSVPQRNLTKTKLPSIKALIDYTPQLPLTNEPETQMPLSPRNSKDLTAASEKLRVRLQFAYYKLRTNRAHSTFKELKSQLEIPTTRPNSRKRRKLVVSQGNYRAPVESQNFLHFSDHSTASIHTTPRNKHQRSLSSLQRQDTPMSVKAAKSLLHLFTSNQH